MNAEEIQAIFFAECEESLAAAESGLAACKAGTQDDDTINAVFRAVHSIKGGAGAFGYHALQAFTHIFETLLSDVREGAVPLSDPLIDLLLRALDIRIADDGAGVNRERVSAKALEKGLIAPDVQLSKEEIDHLIFAPGFSTAAKITNVSGRGVGMDVVRQSVKELGGRITIESEPGAGTAFTLTLPLTLAISDGMVVNVGDQTLVVPLANVVESLRPTREEVQGLGAHRAMINVRGKLIPVLPLHAAVGAQNAIEQAHEGVLIVVETEGAGRAALIVDVDSLVARSLSGGGAGQLLAEAA